MRILEPNPKKKTWQVCRYGPYTEDNPNRHYQGGPLYLTNKIGGYAIRDRVQEWVRPNFFFEADLKFDHVYQGIYRTRIEFTDAEDNTKMEMSVANFNLLMKAVTQGKYILDPQHLIFSGQFTFESVSGNLLVTLRHLPEA